MGVPSLTLLRELSASLTWRSLTPDLLAMRCRPSTPETWLPKEVLRDRSTLSRLRLMPCSRLLRTLRRSPRRLWLMLLALLMSLDLSRIMPTARLLPRAPCSPLLVTLKEDCDAEAAAMRGGKAAMAKLETRIRELESE